MTWTTLHLRVVTPLFSGEDTTETNSPIRVPSIRGVLRFWFRAVAAGHGITDLPELWKQEEMVFGSTRKPSPIALRIRRQPVPAGTSSKPSWATYHTKDGFNGAQYLLGQGLWNYKKGPTRPFVAPAQKIELDIRFSQDDVINARFMLALWAWLTYGGLGARTRRGFGQLACTNVTGDLPGQWAVADLTAPTAAKQWAELGKEALPSRFRHRAGPSWTFLDGDPGNDDPLPEFPALTPRWWTGRIMEGTCSSLDAALDLAGREWRAFRAVADPQAPITSKTSSPEWSHVIRGKNTLYPIAALGLPVGYFSRATRDREQFKATVDPFLKGEPLRRASPVWLRPIHLANGEWRVFTHVFWARLLPTDAELRIGEDGGNRDLPVPDDDTVEEAWDQWAEGRHRLPKNFFPRP